MDVWGRLYVDHHEGRVAPHVLERDDGLAHQIESAESYFEAPRSEVERRYLDALDGPVLDLGAGAGSYALYLQSRGLEATAVDVSEGAVAVSRRRGCQDARVMDIRNLDVDAGHYASFISMGNTLGIQQTPETLANLLRTLTRAARPGARLFCVTRDPLDTRDPDHLRYQARNREQGRPPGLSIIRLRYRDMIGEWTGLWMPTREELGTAVTAAGWSLVDEHALGPNRLRLLALDEERS
jgi:SAM-dependent methyltransferase